MVKDPKMKIDPKTKSMEQSIFVFTGKHTPQAAPDYTTAATIGGLIGNSTNYNTQN